MAINYKGIIQEGKTLKISLTEYDQRFNNRNYSEEKITNFNSLIDATVALQREYDEKIATKESLTSELKEMLKDAQNVYRMVRDAGKNAFAKNSIELKNLGVGTVPSNSVSGLARQLEALATHANTHKTTLMDMGGLLETEIDNIITTANNLREKDAVQNSAKAISKEAHQKLLNKVQELKDECDVIYRIAKMEFRTEKEVYNKIVKAKEERKKRVVKKVVEEDE